MSPGDVVIWPDQLNLPPYVGVVLDSWPGECNGLAEEPPLRVRVLWDDGDAVSYTHLRAHET